MNTDQMVVKQEKEIQEEDQNLRVQGGRWIVKTINYSRGYAKLVHIASGEKRYVALLNFPNYKSRFSWALFERAENAVERRKKIIERLKRMKALG